jgi:hypothetical protein
LYVDWIRVWIWIFTPASQGKFRTITIRCKAPHALRIALCAKVERGNLTVDQAAEIFEKTREAIVEREKTESGQGKGGI